jgi:hypothetical protein
MNSFDIFNREIEAREAKLKTPLDEDNKGFALLKKMGYK